LKTLDEWKRHFFDLGVTYTKRKQPDRIDRLRDCYVDMEDYFEYMKALELGIKHAKRGGE